MMPIFGSDEDFFNAIEKADPDSFGVCCSGCGCYYVGSIKLLGADYCNYACPECGYSRGTFESPALGGPGCPRAIQRDLNDRDGGEEVLVDLYYGLNLYVPPII